MKTEELKNHLDVFVKEIFYGHSTLVITSSDSEKMNRITTVVMGKEMPDKNHSYAKLAQNMYINLYKYVEGTLDESSIIELYKQIMVLRLTGIIINNNDSMTSLKMQMMNAEEKSRQLEKEKEALLEELVNCRGSLDSKTSKVEAIG